MQIDKSPLKSCTKDETTNSEAVNEVQDLECGIHLSFNSISKASIY